MFAKTVNRESSGINQQNAVSNLESTISRNKKQFLLLCPLVPPGQWDQPSLLPWPFPWHGLSSVKDFNCSKWSVTFYMLPLGGYSPNCQGAHCLTCRLLHGDILRLQSLVTEGAKQCSLFSVKTCTVGPRNMVFHGITGYYSICWGKNYFWHFRWCFSQTYCFSHANLWIFRVLTQLTLLNIS